MFSERQQQIIKVSVDLIAERGIQGFTIKNLSKELKISEPAIYRHFESKTAILITILDQFKNFKNEISGNILTSDISSMQKIRLIFDKLLTD